MDWFSFATTALGSGTLTVVATNMFSRRKNKSDITEQSVRTALALEERAHSRYTSAQEALDSAQRALNLAREEIRSYEDYVNQLHDILDAAGIKYPQRAPVIG